MQEENRQSETMTIYDEIKAEREYQDKKWGGPDWDDGKMIEDWINDIIAYTTWAKLKWRMRSPEKYRKRMKQVAALAVAACQSYDRNNDEWEAVLSERRN